MSKITQLGRMMNITTPLGVDYLLINKLSASEALSELFRIDVELMHEENEAGSDPTFIDVKKILGKAVSIEIIQKDGTTRRFNGMVNQFSQGKRDDSFSYYYATIVPHVWLLTQRSQSRIFQHLNVLDILKKVFAGVEVVYEVQGTFEPRNYCVQYRETDFAFASRLMEEEGIYYYFKHEDEGQHKMVLANSPQAHLDCPSKSKIPYALDVSDQEDFISSIGSWMADYKIHSGKVTLWDSHFELPGKHLEAEKMATRPDLDVDQILEIYDFPGGYAQRFDGVDKGGGDRPNDVDKIFQDNLRTAGLRIQEIDAQYKNFSGVADCCAMTAGYRFTLEKHPNKEFNTLHTLVSVTHEIEQSPRYIAEEEVANAYRNGFSCIPLSIPFRPARLTPKPVIQGSQTAFVVGPPGEEIFTDKYGRVKVQFHWDREGQSDADSSCWIRVAQAWAGKKWGAITIPRVGMECVVDFLEGDPDQPIIVGCVYNAAAMPPYDLPKERTKMSTKSDTTPGGNGFNEIRFEDKKGSEDIFIHAEKDIDIRVKSDCRELILNDRHLFVNRDKRERIKRDLHRIVERDVIEDLKRDHFVKITGKVTHDIKESYSHKTGTNQAIEVGGNYAIKVDGNYTVEAKKIVMKAETGITLTVGGNYITINAAGVQINGSLVQINSGGAALPATPGTLVPLQKPLEAEIAINADPGSKLPTYKHQRQQISPIQALSINAPSHNPHSPRNKDKKSWIEVKLVDETGKPVPGEKYRVTLVDGKTLAEGTLDEKGEARVDHIDPGTCKITFPELDKTCWEKG